MRLNRIYQWLTQAGWFWGSIFIAASIIYGISSGVRSEVIILFYVYALLGLGVYLPLVLTDQVSLAYSAYFGIGAYSYAICSANGFADPIVGILLGVLFSGLLATIVGLATVRISGYFLALSTMLVSVVFDRFLIQATALTGGPTGLGFPKTFLWMPISRTELLIGGGVVVVLIAIALSNLARSSTGKALLLLSRSWAAAESIGIETNRARIVALCLGASIASLAGSILALSNGFVIPESYNLMISFLVIFMPILGGVRTPWGCLIGAAIVCYVHQVGHQFGPSQLMLGVTTLAVILLVPGGLLGVIQTLIFRFSPHTAELDQAVVKNVTFNAETSVQQIPERNAEPTASSPGKTILTVKSISKSFGGLQALLGVNFQVREGEILGIVGPNGAGKTTLVDIITGIQEPDSGELMLNSTFLAQGAAFRAQLGISRTFQHPLLAEGLTVLDNIRLGYLRNRAPQTWIGLFIWFLRNLVSGDKGMPRGVQSKKGVLQTYDVTVIENEFPLLSKFLDTAVTDVSYGIEKLTESVRALVSSPPVLVMDEPFAGIDSNSVEEVWRVLKDWRSKGLAAVIVDHNVDLLRDMCDRIVVLNYGQMIAEGKPYDVLQNLEVRKAYFGDE